MRVQSHHTCKVLSTLFALTQCWLKIITIITINCSKPYHSFYIPLQREKVPAANTWYISSPALSPLMEGTTAARLLSTLRWLQPSLQWHKKAEEERGKGGPTTQQHPKGVTAFPQIKAQLGPFFLLPQVLTARIYMHWDHLCHILRPPIQLLTLHFS